MPVHVQLSSYARSGFIHGYSSTRRAVDRLKKGFALSSRMRDRNATIQLSPVRVVCATADATHIFYFGLNLHDFAGIGSFIRHCRHLLLVSSHLRCKNAVEDENTSAKTRVTFSFISSRKSVHVKVSARMRVLPEMCQCRGAHYCASRCSSVLLRTS